MELPGQVHHGRIQPLYLVVDILQLYVLDSVDQISLGRHRGVEAVDVVPQHCHVSVETLLDLLQTVREGVKVNARSLQHGQPPIQAVGGQSTLTHLGHVVAPEDLNVPVQAVDASLGVVDVLAQLRLQVVYLAEKRETC